MNDDINKEKMSRSNFIKTIVKKKKKIDKWCDVRSSLP
jgi:hypothetical protein